jgi:hypothetical protein
MTVMTGARNTSFGGSLSACVLINHNDREFTCVAGERLLQQS